MQYLFGRVCVDAGARRVANRDRIVHLTRKAFDLLLLLLEHRPNAVTKDEIYARLWPDTFVSEASLQTLVHEIRQALDEGDAAPSWIRTVRGIGYSFDGEVLATGDPVAAPGPEPPAAWLVGEAIRVPLRSGENVLGRGVADVIEIDHPAVSRHHARLIVGQIATIEDLGSKNGTWVNNLRVTGPHVLTDRDIVSFGSVRFIFQLARRPMSTESAELPPTK